MGEPGGAGKPVVELLKDIIGRFLQTSGLARPGGAAELEAAWKDAVGPGAEHTRIDAVRDGVAVVVVDSAALLSELAGFRKDELLGALQARVRGQFIRDIKFRPGSLRPRHGPAAQRGRETP